MNRHRLRRRVGRLVAVPVALFALPVAFLLVALNAVAEARLPLADPSVCESPEECATSPEPSEEPTGGTEPSEAPTTDPPQESPAPSPSSEPPGAGGGSGGGGSGGGSGSGGGGSGGGGSGGGSAGGGGSSGDGSSGGGSSGGGSGGGGSDGGSAGGGFTGGGGLTAPAPAVPSASAGLPTIPPTLAAGSGASGSPVRELATTGGNTMPSAMLLGTTAAILVAFAVSVAFLIRERRLQREELEELELDHWRNYR